MNKLTSETHTAGDTHAVGKNYAQVDLKFIQSQHRGNHKTQLTFHRALFRVWWFCPIWVSCATAYWEYTTTWYLLSFLRTARTCAIISKVKIATPRTFKSYISITDTKQSPLEVERYPVYRPASKTGVYLSIYCSVLSPDREGRCAGQSQGPPRTGSQDQPSRHTIGTSSPGTGHTAADRRIRSD